MGRPQALDRLHLAAVSTLGSWLIRMVCCTLRWDRDNGDVWDTRLACSQSTIFVFWHGRILPAVYYFRNLDIVVMTSQHRDGDLITSLIRRFGFGAARGSATRGGRSAVAELLAAIGEGLDVAITIDGPRGPRYVAKPGAVWLACRTGCPIVPFLICHQRKWTLRTWDAFEIPKPFSRALVLYGNPIYVPSDAGQEQLAAAQRALQQSLEDLRRRGDAHWSNTGA